jgi:hypothetical protein
MKTSALVKAGLLALLLTGAFVGGWEWYWRSRGFRISYNDDDSLWASKRKLIYQSNPDGPVLIGSSRIKFDVDLDTWASVSGQQPVQLALTGTSPRPVLTDLGQDPNFRGTLIVDVTEGIFFAPTGAPQERKANERLKAYPKWSPAQQLSFHLNKGLESRLVLLDEDRLTVNSFLKMLPIQNRPKVFSFPRFPLLFTDNDFNRQSHMTAQFVADTAMQSQMKAVWMKLGAAEGKRGAGGDTLLAQLESIKQAVDQIRARGGRVLFVRCPSDGRFLQAENLSYPRALFWDRLLAYTHTPGIHFADYPALARYQCPEWSHLAPRDAITFTRDLIPIIEQKTGWSISARPVARK